MKQSKQGRKKVKLWDERSNGGRERLRRTL